MTAIAKRPLDALKESLSKPAVTGWLQKQIAHSLGRNADQLINVVLQAATQNPVLAKATPSSTLASLIVAAQVGLMPNTALGHCWLVPFNNRRKQGNEWVTVTEATLVIGYQGFIKLIHDASGAGIKAAVVYQGEEFTYNRAAFPPVSVHRHAPEGKRGELTYAYCLVHYPNGVTSGEVYDRPFILARRERSKAWKGQGDKSPWGTDPAAMWLKTAIRAFSSQIPKGSDKRLERAIEIDNLDDAHLGQGAVIDMVGDPMPAEVIDADEQVIEQAARQELGPGAEEELQRWTAEIRQTTTLKEHSEVTAQIAKAKLPEDLLVKLMAVAKDHAARLGGR